METSRVPTGPWKVVTAALPSARFQMKETSTCVSLGHVDDTIIGTLLPHTDLVLQKGVKRLQ